MRQEGSGSRVGAWHARPGPRLTRVPAGEVPEVHPSGDATGRAPWRSAAVVMESRRSGRLLQVVVDVSTSQIHVQLVDDVVVAAGSGMCTLRPGDRTSITALARVTLQPVDDFVRLAPLDINLAVTWVVVPEHGTPVIDVAGTAYLFQPCELRPEEFRARRRDPFNALGPPAPARGPEPDTVAQLTPPRQRPTRRRRFAVLDCGPTPRWAAVGSGTRPRPLERIGRRAS